MFSKDESAEERFHEFVAARASALARTAYLLTGDHHLAEDLVQVALMRTAQHWHRIHGQPEAYARRILVNENISTWRRRRLREVASESYDAAMQPTDTALRLTLEQALKKLTAKQRTVLVLRYYEDLTETQTAHELGIGVGTVKSMTRQALGRLRILSPELSELIGTGDTS